LDGVTAAPQILLTTLNAKYIHASFGLRYLLANMGELATNTELLEFDINQRALEIAETLLARQPRIIGFGVYIWNVRETESVIAVLRRVAPEVLIVLGGPEVSHETDVQTIVALADHVITGEADLEFAALCRKLLRGEAVGEKVFVAPLPALADLRMPYDLYADEDVAHRVLYVEASRGCPFTCEFCLSSLEIPVRQFPLEQFLSAMDRLLARGARQFKFVDRTFNLNLRVSEAILRFFLDRLRPDLFLHFEMIPDRLPESLRQLIARFPAGSLQFEVGIQTFDDQVAVNISRRQDHAKLADNFRYLREETGVHIHADLIAGLPGETLASFGDGFDQLVELRPQEIQVGILKRLKGTPIVRHDAEYGMIYSPVPPFEILANGNLDFSVLQRLRRFARYWDLVGNSGNFVECRELIWSGGRSPFGAFLEFTDWLYDRSNRRHGIALTVLAGFVFEFLSSRRELPLERVAAAVLRDYQRGGRNDIPVFLREHVEAPEKPAVPGRALPKRQARHLVDQA
jgi:radical SAM superfamily enzyme YgiQ (UPF0313 family)